MPKTFQPKPGATVVTVLALGVLLALGFWQLDRLAWKEGMIAHIEGRLAQKSVPLPETIDNPADWEYRRVSIAGSFLPEKAFLVGPRTHEGQSGHHLVVPFQRASGGFVLVNRGWVSDETLKQVTTAQGVVQAEGVATFPKQGAHIPDNVPTKNQWYWIDVPAMAAALDFKNVSNAVLQVTDGKIPAGAPVAHNLRNDHRQYAFFWFCMAGILAVIYFLYHFREKNDGSVSAA